MKTCEQYVRCAADFIQSGLYYVNRVRVCKQCYRDETEAVARRSEPKRAYFIAAALIGGLLSVAWWLA